MSHPTELHRDRAALERWFAAAVDAVDPARATARALAGEPPPGDAPAVLALGKAAVGMARAAERWLTDHDLQPAGGLVVTHQWTGADPLQLPVVTGDHPVPGPASLAAAERLAATIDTLPNGVPVLILISGGTSALLAAPLEGITPDELGEAFAVFHQLGLDIQAMNALRRQLTRWSGGRLARALVGHDVRALVISDVVDNDLAVIGSGPLVGGAVAPETVARILSRPDLVAGLPAAVTAALGAPPPPPVDTIRHTVVADRTMAVQAALDAARAEGVRVRYHRAPLDGEANEAAEALGRWLEGELRDHRLRGGDETGIWVTPAPRVRVLHAWSGELTVRLPTDHGRGGRAQQFALAMARELDRASGRLGFPADVLLLAAGTDGRDGPTDAAGAVVSHLSAAELRAAGVDLDRSIARCDAHPALDTAGALLRTGATGTNVADLVLALCWNWY